MVSWRFFSAKSDLEFCEWNFSGTNEEEASTLFGILEDLGKEVYVATHEDLGAPVCRILWDNTNMALDYREDILNLHALSDDQLADLAERLEASQLDNYMTIISLIGIEFDENTIWGQLTILELKLLICLALQWHEEAQEFVDMFLQFNDNTVESNLFYRAVNTVLEITLSDELELPDYLPNLQRMFGEDTMAAVVGSVSGEVRFHGLTPTSMKLEGLEKHQRLVDSYKKLHAARAAKAGL